MKSISTGVILMENVTKLSLKRSRGDNPYCVPAALALLMDIEVSKSTQLLRDAGVGDVPIKGIYFGLAIKILREHGYEVNRLADNLNWTKLPYGPMFMVISFKHMWVVKDGLMYDNMNPNGHEITGLPVIKSYTTVKYEVTKLDPHKPDTGEINDMYRYNKS